MVWDELGIQVEVRMVMAFVKCNTERNYGVGRDPYSLGKNEHADLVTSYRSDC